MKYTWRQKLSTALYFPIKTVKLSNHEFMLVTFMKLSVDKLQHSIKVNNQAWQMDTYP